MFKFMLKKMREVDLEREDFPELSSDQRQKLTQAVPEVGSQSNLNDRFRLLETVAVPSTNH